ncbi:hypothetical protein HID58_031913 [Brassica napus]|uniref:Uncharacterized protein n=1 Tax=Brassica napus TaxID=3708 RepID=A0ABQ8BUT4_BRANA|nr:hypothetical protein HID58_031913 [Brassica napus]
MAAITVVPNLKPFKSMWKIKVKIIRLGDEKGSTMEATLPFEVLLPEGIYLKEADWFEIYNFKLIKEQGAYTILSSQRQHVFRKIQPLRDSNFLVLANFNTILKGLSHPMYCIDLCGAMVAVGELQQLEKLGPGEIFSYQNTRMEFTLVNTEFELLTLLIFFFKKQILVFIYINMLTHQMNDMLQHLKCVAYGKEAVTLSEYNLNSPAPVNVCVLRSWRIHWGEGGFRYITNLESSS